VPYILALFEITFGVAVHSDFELYRSAGSAAPPKDKYCPRLSQSGTV